MIRKFTLLFSLTVLIFSGSAQEILPSNCYMQLSGSIHKEILLNMNMVKVGDSLYGDYTVLANEAGKNTKCGEIGQPRQFFGKINQKGKLWIKTWPGDQGFIFNGQFKKTRGMTGICESKPGNGKKLSFELAEKFPEGGIRFNPYILKDHKKLLKDPKSPQASIRMVLLAPVFDSNYCCSDTIRRIMFGRFADDQDNQISPENLLSDVRKDFFDNYMKDNASIYKEMPGASFAWELLRYTHIISNENNKLTFYIISYSFTGGAHGQSSQVFTTVDLKSGKVLTPADLFKTGFEADLTRLLTQKLHHMTNLADSRKLTESGYFVDEIKPNNNFFLNANGIGFLYNQYEIAPYSFGQTEIFMTMEELKSLLKTP